jgi:hypothetical protein
VTGALRPPMILVFISKSFVFLSECLTY